MSPGKIKAVCQEWVTQQWRAQVCRTSYAVLAPVLLRHCPKPCCCSTLLPGSTINKHRHTSLHRKTALLVLFPDFSATKKELFLVGKGKAQELPSSWKNIVNAAQRCDMRKWGWKRAKCLCHWCQGGCNRQDVLVAVVSYSSGQQMLFHGVAMGSLDLLLANWLYFFSSIS